MKETRSLIDASEKPLRRSPPGMPHKQEEWPVLSPQKLTATYTSRTVSHHEKLPGSSIPNERYHKFDNSSPPAALISHKGGTKLSPSHNVRRKQIPPTKPRDQLGPTCKPVETVKHFVQQAKNNKNGDVPTASRFVESSSSVATTDLSSSAAAVEKSAYEAGSLGHPRQTRTSSLRARLSASQSVKETSDMKTKVMGFTNFTSVNEASTKPSKDSLSFPGETRSRSQAQTSTDLLRAKSSEGSMRANRAPAQFVGGSRRPNNHRPTSRSSLRSDSRATGSSPTLQPPKRPAPAVPISSEVLQPAKFVEAEESKTTEPRQSSIPVFRPTVSSMISQAENGIAPVKTKEENDSGGNDTFRNALDILEDQALEPIPLDSNEEAIDKSSELTNSDNSMPYPLSLQAIEESPRQGYHIKRLSVTSPENGPTLKISPDAERLIMGVEADKEKGSKYKIGSKGKELRDSFRKSNLHYKASGTESMADLKKRLERPSSSQGLSQSSSRFGLISKESREKKVRSAEHIYSLSTNHLHQQSAKPTEPKTPLARKSTDKCVADDPFYDVHSTLEQEPAKMVNPAALDKDPSSDEKREIIEEASWISPLVNKHNDLSKGKAVGSAPPALQTDRSSGSSTNHKYSIAATPAEEAAHMEQIPSEGMSKSKDIVEKPLPSTPERSRDSNNSTLSFPPRSSSRTTPPDYTTKRSPASQLEGGNPTPKEFLHRHNQLGASKGHASSPVEVSHVAGTKRDSTARESARSQNSISKGMLSNIRGLFHKRSSDNEPYSMRSSKKFKPSTSIALSGSPFLPISEIHPIHRPTLASSNRSVVKGQNPTPLDTNVNTPATPSFMSPLPSEISATTTLAMQLLDSVRTERSSPRKERALELGTIMVEALTQARDAERAMEEAKQAARRAEVACALCKKAVGDVSRRVLEWRDEFSD